MKIRSIKAKWIAQCPSHIFSADHYDDAGVCKCKEEA